MPQDLIDPTSGGRELREGLYDVMSFAKTTTIPAVVSFFGHTQDSAGPGVTNMSKPNELPAGERMDVYSLRFAILNGAAADVSAIRKNYRLRVYVADKAVLTGKTEKFPYGGSATSEASEVGAGAFWINDDTLVIRIQESTRFRVNLEAQAGYLLTDANKGVDFLCELDGIHSVPIN